MIESTQLPNGLMQLTATGGYVHKIDTDIYVQSLIMLPMDTLDMYEEVSEKPTYTYEEYKTKVRELIKEKYTIEDEIALNRQKDTKQDEFNLYNLFCENCKVKAKQILSNG